MSGHLSLRERNRLRYLTSGAALLWGAFLFSRPRLIDGLLDDRSPSPVEVGLTRALGARHIVGAIALAAPTRRTRNPLLLTEAAHAGSMVALAVVSQRHRRIAVASMVAAGVLAGATAVVTGKPSH
jgi:hypothetical protein